MTKILIFILLIFPVGLSAQISGEVEFGTEYIEMYADTSKIADDFQRKFIVKRENEAKRALADNHSYFIVKFNDQGAVTEDIPIMEVDGGLNPLDYTYVSNKYYYIGGTPYENYSFFINDRNEYYVKKDKNNYVEWEISDERKSILGYSCQKAVTYFLDKEGKKKKDKPIIVWFTSEIPASYGPYRYHGLPGFILELHELGRRHYARKITLNKKVKIDFPNEEDLYTREEFKEKRNK